MNYFGFTGVALPPSFVTLEVSTQVTTTSSSSSSSSVAAGDDPVVFLARAGRIPTQDSYDLACSTVPCKIVDFCGARQPDGVYVGDVGVMYPSASQTRLSIRPTVVELASSESTLDVPETFTVQGKSYLSLVWTPKSNYLWGASTFTVTVADHKGSAVTVYANPVRAPTPSAGPGCDNLGRRMCAPGATSACNTTVFPFDCAGLGAGPSWRALIEVANTGLETKLTVTGSLSTPPALALPSRQDLTLYSEDSLRFIVTVPTAGVDGAYVVASVLNILRGTVKLTAYPSCATGGTDGGGGGGGAFVSPDCQDTLSCSIVIRAQPCGQDKPQNWTIVATAVLDKTYKDTVPVGFTLLVVKRAQRIETLTLGLPATGQALPGESVSYQLDLAGDVGPDTELELLAYVNGGAGSGTVDVQAYAPPLNASANVTASLSSCAQLQSAFACTADGKRSCDVNLQPCELRKSNGTWTFVVSAPRALPGSGPGLTFFTIRASLRTPAALSLGALTSGVVRPGRAQQYKISIPSSSSQNRDALLDRTSPIQTLAIKLVALSEAAPGAQPAKGITATLYVNYAAPAGCSECYGSIRTLTVTTPVPQQSYITIPACEVIPGGTYYISVNATALAQGGTTPVDVAFTILAESAAPPARALASGKAVSDSLELRSAKVYTLNTANQNLDASTRYGFRVELITNPKGQTGSPRGNLTVTVFNGTDLPGDGYYGRNPVYDVRKVDPTAAACLTFMCAASSDLAAPCLFELPACWLSLPSRVAVLVEDREQNQNDRLLSIDYTLNVTLVAHPKPVPLFSRVPEAVVARGRTPSLFAPGPSVNEYRDFFVSAFDYNAHRNLGLQILTVTLYAEERRTGNGGDDASVAVARATANAPPAVSADPSATVELYARPWDLAGSPQELCRGSVAACSVTSGKSCSVQISPCEIGKADLWYFATRVSPTAGAVSFAYTVTSEWTGPESLTSGVAATGDLDLGSLVHYSFLLPAKLKSSVSHVDIELLLPSAGQGQGSAATLYVNAAGYAGSASPLAGCASSCLRHTHTASATTAAKAVLTLTPCEVARIVARAAAENPASPTPRIYLSVQATAIGASDTFELVATLRDAAPAATALTVGAFTNGTMDAVSFDVYDLVVPAPAPGAGIESFNLAVQPFVTQSQDPASYLPFTVVLAPPASQYLKDGVCAALPENQFTTTCQRTSKTAVDCKPLRVDGMMFWSDQTERTWTVGIKSWGATVDYAFVPSISAWGALTIGQTTTVTPNPLTRGVILDDWTFKGPDPLAAGSGFEMLFKVVNSPVPQGFSFTVTLREQTSATPFARWPFVKTCEGVTATCSIFVPPCLSFAALPYTVEVRTSPASELPAHADFQPIYSVLVTTLVPRPIQYAAGDNTLSSATGHAVFTVDNVVAPLSLAPLSLSPITLPQGGPAIVATIIGLDQGSSHCRDATSALVNANQVISCCATRGSTYIVLLKGQPNQAFSGLKATVNPPASLVTGQAQPFSITPGQYFFASYSFIGGSVPSALTLAVTGLPAGSKVYAVLASAAPGAGNPADAPCLASDPDVPVGTSAGLGSTTTIYVDPCLTMPALNGATQVWNFGVTIPAGAGGSSANASMVVSTVGTAKTYDITSIGAWPIVESTLAAYSSIYVSIKLPNDANTPFTYTTLSLGGGLGNGLSVHMVPFVDPTRVPGAAQGRCQAVRATTPIAADICTTTSTFVIHNSLGTAANLPSIKFTVKALPTATAVDGQVTMVPVESTDFLGGLVYTTPAPVFSAATGYVNFGVQPGSDANGTVTVPSGTSVRAYPVPPMARPGTVACGIVDRTCGVKAGSGATGCGNWLDFCDTGASSKWLFVVTAVNAQAVPVNATGLLPQAVNPTATASFAHPGQADLYVPLVTGSATGFYPFWNLTYPDDAVQLRVSAVPATREAACALAPAAVNTGSDLLSPFLTGQGPAVLYAQAPQAQREDKFQFSVLPKESLPLQAGNLARQTREDFLTLAEYGQVAVSAMANATNATNLWARYMQFELNSNLRSIFCMTPKFFVAPYTSAGPTCALPVSAGLCQGSTCVVQGEALSTGPQSWQVAGVYDGELRDKGIAAYNVTALIKTVRVTDCQNGEAVAWSPDSATVGTPSSSQQIFQYRYRLSSTARGAATLRVIVRVPAGAAGTGFVVEVAVNRNRIVPITPDGATSHVTNGVPDFFASGNLNQAAVEVVIPARDLAPGDYFLAATVSKYTVGAAAEPVTVAFVHDEVQVAPIPADGSLFEYTQVEGGFSAFSFDAPADATAVFFSAFDLPAGSTVYLSRSHLSGPSTILSGIADAQAVCTPNPNPPPSGDSWLSACTASYGLGASPRPARLAGFSICSPLSPGNTTWFASVSVPRGNGNGNVYAGVRRAAVRAWAVSPAAVMTNATRLRFFQTACAEHTSTGRHFVVEGVLAGLVGDVFAPTVTSTATYDLYTVPIASAATVAPFCSSSGIIAPQETSPAGSRNATYLVSVYSRYPFEERPGSAAPSRGFTLSTGPVLQGSPSRLDGELQPGIDLLVTVPSTGSMTALYVSMIPMKARFLSLTVSSTSNAPGTSVTVEVLPDLLGGAPIVAGLLTPSFQNWLTLKGVCAASADSAYPTVVYLSLTMTAGNAPLPVTVSLNVAGGFENPTTVPQLPISGADSFWTYPSVVIPAGAGLTASEAVLVYDFTPSAPGSSIAPGLSPSFTISNFVGSSALTVAGKVITDKTTLALSGAGCADNVLTVSTAGGAKSWTWNPACGLPDDGQGYRVALTVGVVPSGPVAAPVGAPSCESCSLSSFTLNITMYQQAAVGAVPNGLDKSTVATFAAPANAPASASYVATITDLPAAFAQGGPLPWDTVVVVELRPLNVASAPAPSCFAGATLRVALTEQCGGFIGSPAVAADCSPLARGGSCVLVVTPGGFAVRPREGIRVSVTSVGDGSSLGGVSFEISVGVMSASALPSAYALPKGSTDTALGRALVLRLPGGLTAARSVFLRESQTSSRYAVVPLPRAGRARQNQPALTATWRELSVSAGYVRAVEWAFAASTLGVGDALLVVAPAPGSMVNVQSTAGTDEVCGPASLVKEPKAGSNDSNDDDADGPFACPNIDYSIYRRGDLTVPLKGKRSISAGPNPRKRFEWLVQAFGCPSREACGRCPGVVSKACRDALRDFACNEAYPTCQPRTGFALPLCESACTEVVRACGLTFVEAGLPGLDCGSPRYAREGECTPYTGPKHVNHTGLIVLFVLGGAALGIAGLYFFKKVVPAGSLAYPSSSSSAPAATLSADVPHGYVSLGDSSPMKQ
jgi:hypothetical protein